MAIWRWAGGLLMVLATGTWALAATPTWTRVSSSGNPTLVGQSVTFTASVKPIGGGGTPTGTVTFKDAATVLGSGTLNGAGEATLSTSSLALGTHHLTAVYGGDGAFASSASEPFAQAIPAVVGCTPSFFYAAAALSPSDSAHSLATGDFNLDGKPDLVAASTGGGNNLPIFLGDGWGGFTFAGSVTSMFMVAVVVRDFNQDGKPDLAASAQDRVNIFLGNGTGGFAEAPGSPIPFGSFFDSSRATLAAADFNADGREDLVLLDWISHNVKILLGDGSGGFSTAAGSPFPSSSPQSSFVTTADFNSDGRPDLVLAAAGGPTDYNVTVRLGDGAGGFGPAIVVATGNTPVLGDFNHDTMMDLAIPIGASSPGNVTIFLGDGAGGFSAAPGSPTGTGGRPSASGDFDGDGKLDLLLSNGKVALGDGAGGLSASGIGPFGTIVLAAVDDFNLDGKADFAAFNGSSVLSFVNNCGATATTTTVVASPSPSMAGEPVLLTATVAPVAGSATPTGRLQFLNGSFSLGSPVTLGAGGVATLSTTALTEGVRALGGLYLGDGNFTGSTSSPFSHTVLSRVTINDATANSATATTMSFTVSLSALSSLSVTVDYATSNHTAVAGTNYTTTTGTLTFDPGQFQKTITVPILQGTPGPSKDFFVTLSNLTNATFSKATGIGTITYAAAGSLTLGIDDPSLKEGHTGSTLLGFTVSLSRPNTSAVSVDYATADGTAASGTDYTARSGTITFPPGRTTRSILIPVPGNTTVGSNRTFFVNLTNITGGAQATKSQGTGTILDDDLPLPATGGAQRRLYSPTTKEHLYTIDANEYAVLATRGWIQEGTAYTIFAEAGSFGSAYSIPIYRLYHAGVAQHHWTTDANEVTVLAGQVWDYEGIAGYLLPTQESGSVPLYRLMLANPALHLWTTDANEKTVLSTQRGWVYEGIVGYVVP